MMKILNIITFCAITIIVISSCKSKKIDYITYYNEVYAADSIMRFENDTIKALKKYRKIFRQFEPIKHDNRINEFETFIVVSDQFNRKFGGKKNLFKLIKLNAPEWELKKDDKDFINLNRKYGIDSLTIVKEVNKWKTGTNKNLVDTFQIALERDQRGRPIDTVLVKKNVDINARLLIWTFENYGFPTIQKIGWFPMPTFLTHMIESDKYPYFKNKIIEYVKSGECNPRDYARMVDYNISLIEKKDSTYYGFNGSTIKDSATINKNRKKIGLPSLKHGTKITRDWRKKTK